MPAPVASGWSDRRVGLAPTGKAPPSHGARGKRPFGSAPWEIATYGWADRPVRELPTKRRDPEVSVPSIGSPAGKIKRPSAWCAQGNIRRKTGKAYRFAPVGGVIWA